MVGNLKKDKKPVDDVAVVADGKDAPLKLLTRMVRTLVSSEQTPIYQRF